MGNPATRCRHESNDKLAGSYYAATARCIKIVAMPRHLKTLCRCHTGKLAGMCVVETGYLQDPRPIQALDGLRVRRYNDCSLSFTGRDSFLYGVAGFLLSEPAPVTGTPLFLNSKVHPGIEPGGSSLLHSRLASKWSTEWHYITPCFGGPAPLKQVWPAEARVKML